MNSQYFTSNVIKNQNTFIFCYTRAPVLMYYCIQMSMAEAPVGTVRFTTVTALRNETLGNKASHVLRGNSILFVLPLGNSITTGFQCLGL